MMVIEAFHSAQPPTHFSICKHSFGQQHAMKILNVLKAELYEVSVVVFVVVGFYWCVSVLVVVVFVVAGFYWFVSVVVFVVCQTSNLRVILIVTSCSSVNRK